MGRRASRAFATSSFRAVDRGGMLAVGNMGLRGFGNLAIAGIDRTSRRLPAWPGVADPGGRHTCRVFTGVFR